MSSNLQIVVGVIFIALCYALGVVFDQYWLSLSISILGNIILALSWNMTASAGMISIGHVAFWGIGAYTAANLQIHYYWPMLPTVAAGAVTGVMGGLLIGIVTTRVRAFYFAISTIAFAEALRVIATMFPDVTGGTSGLFLRADPGLPSVETIYFVYVTLMACSFATAVWIMRSRVWFALTAMRENEAAARMLGINPVRHRLLAICLSTVWAGAAGAAGVYLPRYLSPDTVLVLPISVQAQVAPIAGGAYTLMGPVLGGLLLSGGAEYLRTMLPPGANLIVYGVSLVLFIIFLPQGIVGGVGDLLARRKVPSAAVLARKVRQARPAEEPGLANPIEGS